jgi:hypothetical protein
VRSNKAGQRVLKGISIFIEKKLKLKVNEAKSGTQTPEKVKLLGFTFYKREGKYVIQIAPKSIERFKAKVRKLTDRKHSEKITDKLSILSKFTNGWVNYFKIAELDWHFTRLDEMIRSRLRICIWTSWKTSGNRERNLIKLGVSPNNAIKWSKTSKGACRISHSPILLKSLTNAYFKELGYSALLAVYQRQHV